MELTIEEIKQLLNWYVGEFTGSAPLLNKLKREKRKLEKLEHTIKGCSK